MRRMPYALVAMLGVALLAVLATVLGDLTGSPTVEPLSERAQPGQAPSVAASSPPASRSPQPSPPLVPAGADDDPVPTTAGLAAAVATELGRAPLAGHLSGVVLDVASGQPLFAVGADDPVLPASTVKLLTAAAALTVLEPDHRLVTRVVAGSAPGEIVLVGGGDPTLAGPAARPDYPTAARLTDLATAVAQAGVGRVDRVLVDTSLYVGEPLGPQWKQSYVTGGHVAPVSALMMDGGRVRPDGQARVSDPAAVAARSFAELLRRAGVPGRLAVTDGRGSSAAPVDARQLAQVTSAPVPALVERMLTDSDNDLAEALARQVALARGQAADFGGAAAAITATVVELGLDPAAVRLADGSGLSRANRLTPAAVTSLLTMAADADRPELRPVLTGLPVAGFSGTLATRYRTGQAGLAAGEVRAKTGSLTGASALAGIVVTADGRLLAFDMTADGLPPGTEPAAQVALDRVAAALAGCGCR